MKLTTEEFDNAYKSWAHIINQLDPVSLGALATAARTAMGPVFVGDWVRYVGHPDDSGFTYGEFVEVTGVYSKSISARRAGDDMGFFISSGDYIGIV